ncbi:MAG TPA: hypothetical protein ENI51_05230 [Candidatus Atribacteria bacterium]|nr:hypothetical protein [Candidatus Atribacteria bacterium]
MKQRIFSGVSIFGITIAIFLSVAVSYEVHRFSSGIVFSSRCLTFLVFFIFLAVFSLEIWPWMGLGSDIPKNISWKRPLLISILAVFLSLTVWMGAGTFDGDYLVHKQFSLQLLNGNSQTHFFYKNTPTYYPYLAHALLAILTNITGLKVHYSYLFISLALSFSIPLLTYRLAIQLGFAPNLSLFFSALISLYGGFLKVIRRMFHLYLPAIQISMPFISRNLCFFIFILFLILCFRLYRLKEPDWKISINIGILIGLMALSHPQGFLMSLLFLAISCLIKFKLQYFSKSIFLHFITSLFIAFVIASFYYLPVFINMLQYGGATPVEKAKEVFPNMIWLYGPLIPLWVYGLMGRKNIKGWFWLSLLMIGTIGIVRLILDFFLSVDQWNIFRLHRFGPYLFIFLSLFATRGVENIINSWRRIKNIGIIIMIPVVVIGHFTAYIYLSNLYRYKYKFKKVFVELKEGKMYALFPASNIEDLRLKIDNPRISLIVPPEISLRVASEAGLHIAYIERPRIRYKDYFKKTISQEERLSKVASFYQDLQRGILRKDILDFFNTNMFLSSHSDLTKVFPLLEKICSVQVKGGVYYLYAINYE